MSSKNQYKLGNKIRLIEIKFIPVVYSKYIHLHFIEQLNSNLFMLLNNRYFFIQIHGDANANVLLIFY